VCDLSSKQLHLENQVAGWNMRLQDTLVSVGCQLEDLVGGSPGMFALNIGAQDMLCKVGYVGCLAW